MLKNKKLIDEAINKYVGKKGSLIPLMQEIQNIEKYLSKETMRYISQKSGVKLADIFGVATFYTMFRLKPQGKHIIRVCKGTACHVRGGSRIADRVGEILDVQEGETTEDGRFTMERVNCLGCCALGPVMMVDQDYHGNITSAKVEEILERYS